MFLQQKTTKIFPATHIESFLKAAKQEKNRSKVS
jgi:hypothetical protein